MFYRDKKHNVFQTSLPRIGDGNYKGAIEVSRFRFDESIKFDEFVNRLPVVQTLQVAYF